jgi:hypothetical protein
MRASEVKGRMSDRRVVVMKESWVCSKGGGRRVCGGEDKG